MLKAKTYFYKLMLNNQKYVVPNKYLNKIINIETQQALVHRYSCNCNVKTKKTGLRKKIPAIPLDIPHSSKSWRVKSTHSAR